MPLDPQIVAQATAFVNALRAGKSARMPVLKMKNWKPFMDLVHAGLGLA
ncbi:MAG: succinate dehydrogenase flavoprotein subunit [Pantoea sp.]|nr:succinate dehydrogenase flavoprotein subunit [Pantoea sp.]MDE1188854.1 succinate dehydrogenase flavoprotein subunit [Pantoea sp.]